MNKPKIFIFPKKDHGPLGKTYQTLSEDGTPLGSHISSDDQWAMIDIQTHAEDFENHYPEGYDLELINDCNEKFHEALRANVSKFGKQNFDHPRNARITITLVDDDGKELTQVIE